MSLFRKNRLIAVIAQKVIFWIRPQILSVMADGCCFNDKPDGYEQNQFGKLETTNIIIESSL